MLDLSKFQHDLLDPQTDEGEVPSSFAACLNARGLYHNMHFVLRLSPRVHELIDAVENGIHSSDDIDEETFQAFSTYLHETVHWWQHMGSTSGLVLSLAYPGQTHTSMKHLRAALTEIGPKKSLKHWAEEAAFGRVPASTTAIQNANVGVNNALDIEFYKALMLRPDLLETLFQDPYFESVGHSFEMAYGHTLSMLSGSFDKDFAHFPKAPDWDDKFRELAAKKHIGFFHGSPLVRVPTGLLAIYEGQARFTQLQYLAGGSGGQLSFKDLRSAGYLSGIYVEAFDTYLKLIEADWPDGVMDPLVGLFLLVCDIAINPTRGFPVDIQIFEDFILDVDPGVRFARLCLAIKDHPELKTAVTDYSRSEYEAIAAQLTEITGYDHPLAALSIVVDWMEDVPGVRAVMEEHETFDFDLINLPVRVLFSHFCAFSRDKLNHPEFYCWPGAWMAGPRASQSIQDLFLNHLSLFSDKADDDGIFPRMVPGRDEENVQKTFNRFYAGVLLYDLTRQWVLLDGAFKYDYDWLSKTTPNGPLAKRIREMFEHAYGADPEDFELLR